jgi:HD-GYP domain-containing protein (c-di-GMP phosphodiesterase class II)
MTTIALERPSSVENLAGGQPDQSGTVKVDVESLVAGRQLKNPIFDPGNLLLLAQGSIVTPRFKQLLLARGIREVMLSRADAESMSAPQQPSTAGCFSAARQLDSALTQKIDKLVDAGLLFQENSGPRLKERLVLQGCKGFGVEQRDALLAQHTQTCEQLDAMIKAAAHGQPVSGQEIAGVVASYLTNLTSDADCVLDVARQAGHYAALAEHCLLMSVYGMALGIEMGMCEMDIRNIGLSGLLHDWGMSLISPEILDANRVLTNAEFLEIKKHPGYTLDLLKSISTIPDIVPMICYQVHERPNGTGYPRGRMKNSIHPGARILNVADVYLALTSPRPYRKPLMPYAAIECLLRQAKENLVDADVVRALLQVVSLFPIGSHVMLSDGSTARVLRRNGNNYSSPIVQIIKDASGDLTDPLDETQIVDPSTNQLRIVKAVPASDSEQITIDFHSVRLMRG